MPAHIRTALTQASEHIPIGNGRLVLGMWQGVYLWEHRDRGSTDESYPQRKYNHFKHLVANTYRPN